MGIITNFNIIIIIYNDTNNNNHCSSFSGTLPSAVCNLTMLKSVEIPFNRFYGLLPSCLFNQSVNQQNLSSLVLSNNLFRGHLPEKTYLPKLYDLFLESNLFSGTIPRSFLLKMKTLQYLALGSNNFSLSEAPDLRDLDNIIYIDMSNCNLQGRLPELNMNKTHLKQFSANNNILSGAVPASFSNATKLLVISLYNNR
jgi:LRR receptor-like serine/threonine-protein kinase FLS2